MKKLMNRPDAAVDEMLEGMLALHSQLSRLEHFNVLVRRDAETVRNRQVALISGGGSGHEPAHGGYVGEGALSAAVAGGIFTSPTVDAVYAAIRAVAGQPGVLLIVKNYTGDRLNFGLAAEMARAEGISVRMVIVADDVALASSGNRRELAGARGLAGTVLIHKIAGAVAAAGRSLDEVHAEAEAAAAALGTMGVSLAAGTSPVTGKPSFILTDQEIELGLGIHGEPGVRRATLLSADELTDMLIEKIISARSMRAGERVAVLLNNLGATTAMELAIVARRVFANLTGRGMTIERFYSGTLLTSLDMAGISLSLLSVDNLRLERLDAATSAPAWPNASKERPEPPAKRILAAAATETSARARSRSPGAGLPSRASQETLAGQAILAACAALFDAEDELTEMDRLVGDGDLGISLARGARAVKSALPEYPLHDLPQTLRQIGNTLRSELGGSSGPLYGVLFMRVGAALEGRSAHEVKAWGESLEEACGAIGEMGGAAAGDRTMLDALIPFADVLCRESTHGAPAKDLLQAAADAAAKGAQDTAAMLPRRGRSSYLGTRALGKPDPGAVAVSLWLNAVVRTLNR
jgi:triose/dihydroxyacetone kinase / FAD-AMP lyase (cyclizing)